MGSGHNLVDKGESNVEIEQDTEKEEGIGKRRGGNTSQVSQDGIS